MVNIYLNNGKGVEYFIESIEENDCINFTESVICESSFSYKKDVQNVCCESNLRELKKNSFKCCGDVRNFVCGKIGAVKTENTKLKGVDLFSSINDFIIETSSFYQCENLETVILPEILDDKKLIIEKDAFMGCTNLRTFFCICDKISFTGNPFESCPDYLTFIGKSGSELERFARENNYRFVNAGY